MKSKNASQDCIIKCLWVEYYFFRVYRTVWLHFRKYTFCWNENCAPFRTINLMKFTSFLISSINRLPRKNCIHRLAIFQCKHTIN